MSSKLTYGDIIEILAKGNVTTEQLWNFARGGNSNKFNNLLVEYPQLGQIKVLVRPDFSNRYEEQGRNDEVFSVIEFPKHGVVIKQVCLLSSYSEETSNFPYGYGFPVEKKTKTVEVYE